MFVGTDRPNMKLIIVLSFLTAVLAAPPTNKENKLHMKNYFLKSPHHHAHPVPRITNGQEAVPHSIPHQVLLTQVDKHNVPWSCGGILISSKYVLTAAVCGAEAVSAQAVLGAHNISQREETQVTIPIKSMKIHDNFDYSEYLNDIAVYELETEAPLNVNIQPAKLPSRKDVNETYAGQIARVSGWGATTAPSDLETSSVLNYVLEAIVTNEQCSEELEIDVTDLQDSNICLEGKNDKMTCFADYGGPLSVDDVVVGVVSFGIYCFPGAPSIFTRITSFLDWIEENTDVVIQ